MDLSVAEMPWSGMVKEMWKNILEHFFSSAYHHTILIYACVTTCMHYHFSIIDFFINMFYDFFRHCKLSRLVFLSFVNFLWEYASVCKYIEKQMNTITHPHKTYIHIHVCIKYDIC